MKLLKKAFAFTFIFMLSVSGLTGYQVNASEEPKHLDILFTHDLHSHLNSFQTIVDGTQQETGGFARLKTLINEHEKENTDTLILDGGDFSMGTLIQTVYDTEAAELRMLGYLGCDVTTLGNHEFDYGSDGLADMLNAAVSSGENLPRMVVCNVDWDAMKKAGLSEGQKQIYEAFQTYGVKDYTVIQKGDVKIAVLGVFGKDSLDCAPTCELLFKDPSEAARETVEEIKKNEDVDMIACVSHSGTWEDEKVSEDEILAKNVPDIDLIVSGHTHTQLAEPILQGDTCIVSCGEYGKNLGTLSMTQKENGRWETDTYELVPVTDEIKADKATQKKIDELSDTVDINYLSNFGYTREEILAENDIEFNSLSEMETKHEELNLGDIISDAYVYAVENTGDSDGEKVDVAIVPAGTVRDTYTKGDITVEQVYNSFSLGTGKDGEREEIQDDKLYHVVTDLYTGRMLGSVLDKSYGLISIVPKDKNGNPIENLEDYAVMDGKKELKAWAAIAEYMQSFEDTDKDGIANVPEYYDTTHERKVADNSKNIINLIKHPNKFAIAIVGICIVAVGVILLLIFGVVKIIRRRR